ncbi:MAG: hypothetical protein HQL56_16560 [Magnetococcales bacterium]|nr:hypothetical protein [Magnetococcales bacterium]
MELNRPSNQLPPKLEQFTPHKEKINSPMEIVSGEVISVYDDQVCVATRYGLIEVGGYGLKPDDQVVIQEGWAVLKQPFHNWGFRL